MTELQEVDVEGVWLSGRYWQSTEYDVVHLDADCPRLQSRVEPRGPVDPDVLQPDVRICEYCDNEEPPDGRGPTGPSLAHKLRHGELQDATLGDGGDSAAPGGAE